MQYTIFNLCILFNSYLLSLCPPIMHHCEELGLTFLMKKMKLFQLVDVLLGMSICMCMYSREKLAAVFKMWASEEKIARNYHLPRPTNHVPTYTAYADVDDPCCHKTLLIYSIEITVQWGPESFSVELFSNELFPCL